jgi:hypothetical protein
MRRFFIMSDVLYAGELESFKSRSMFDTLDQFNEYYRKLKLRLANEDVLTKKQETILSLLFRLSKSMKGLSYPRRDVLAKEAGCGTATVDRFLKFAIEYGFMKTEPIYSHPSKGKRKRGGYAHLLYIFKPIEDLPELPSETTDKADDETDDKALMINRPDADKPCESKDEEPKKQPQTGFSFKQDLKQDLNSLKANSNKPSHEIDSDSHYENNREYAIAAGIHEEIVNELKPFVRTSEIITIGKAINGVLRKAGNSIEDTIDTVIASIRQSVTVYKQGKARKGFGAAICGTLKGKLSDLKKEIEEFFADSPLMKKIEEKYEQQPSEEECAIRRAQEAFQTFGGTSEGYSAYEKTIEHLCGMYGYTKRNADAAFYYATGIFADTLLPSDPDADLPF